MQIYDSFGPNPRALRMFLAEKGMTIPTKELDILGAENRRAPYTDRNPGGQFPALELDDGAVIGETVAIFEYLEEQNPKPSLIGSNAEGACRDAHVAATHRAAHHREPLQRLPLRRRPRAVQGPHARSARGGPGLKQAASDNLSLARQAARQPPVHRAGDRFTISDIILFCALDFGASVGQAVPSDTPKVKAWFDRVSARPSAKASLHPNSAQAGMRG